MVRADEDTEEYAATEEYEEETEEYVKVVRAMKRSSSEVYANKAKCSRQQGCASSDEDRHLPQQLAFVPCDGPEGGSLLGPSISSSRTNCRPCIRK